MNVTLFRPALMIGVPFTGERLRPEWGWSFAQIQTPMMTYIRRKEVTGKPVDVARQEIADEAQVEKCRWLFYVDQDVEPPPHALKRLIHVVENYPDAAMATGIICEKTDAAHPMIAIEAGRGPSWDWKVGTVFPIAECGLGCALIRVDALAQLPRPWFRLIEATNTEDIWFCDLVLRHGRKIYADGGVLCRHRDIETGRAYVLPIDARPYRVEV